jgi:hypothetical protein
MWPSGSSQFKAQGSVKLGTGGLLVGYSTDTNHCVCTLVYTHQTLFKKEIKLSFINILATQALAPAPSRTTSDMYQSRRSRTLHSISAILYRPIESCSKNRSINHHDATILALAMAEHQCHPEQDHIRAKDNNHVLRHHRSIRHQHSLQV